MAAKKSEITPVVPEQNVLKDALGPDPETDATFGGYVTCPRCKWDTRKNLFPIGEEDKKEYLRCVLGGGCFSKMFSFFGGAFQIEFIDLTGEESDAVVRLIRTILSDEMLIVKALKIKILFALTAITISGKETTFDRKALVELEKTGELDVDKALKEFNKRFGSLPETVSGLISRTYHTFSEILVGLAEGGLDENFGRALG